MKNPQPLCQEGSGEKKTHSSDQFTGIAAAPSTAGPSTEQRQQPLDEQGGGGVDPIHGAGPYSPGRWPFERLPLLDSLAPLLPGGPDKRPRVGEEWQKHAGLAVWELQQRSSACICWHVGADGCWYIAIDIDGPKAIAFCQENGCDPLTTDTWRIVRTSNADRLKLVFRVTPEQKETLAAGHKTVKIDGEEFAVFAGHGHQIVVLGNHYTKESGYKEHDDQYAWDGRLPEDAQPIPEEWFKLLTDVFCGDRPLKPPTRRQVSPGGAPRLAGSNISGGWRNSDGRNPCPICGRDHSGGCSITADNEGAWCCHGQTCSAPDCSRAGEVVLGADGREWGYVPGVNYVGGSRQLRRRVTPGPPPAMAGGGDSEK